MAKSGPPVDRMRLKPAGGWADASDVNDPINEAAARFNEHEHELGAVSDEDLADDRRVKTLDGSGGWMMVRGTATPGQTGDPGSLFMFCDGPHGDPGFIEAPTVGVLVTTEEGDDPLVVAVREVGVTGFRYVVFEDNGVLGTAVETDCVVHWSAMGRVSGG